MITLCACMGPMYGEPYCACTMKRMGLEKEMEENPLRIAADKRAKEDLKGIYLCRLEKFFEMNREANAN